MRAPEETTLTLSAVKADDVDAELPDRDDVPSGIGVLVVRTGRLAGSSFRLDAPRTVIGRSPEADIFLDDITVSRRHAEIRRSASGYRVVDLDSLNGTYVDGVRIDDVVLGDAAGVRIGRFELTFLLGEGNQPR